MRRLKKRRKTSITIPQIDDAISEAERKRDRFEKKPLKKLILKEIPAVKKRKLRKKYKKQKCAFYDVVTGSGCKRNAVGKSTLCKKHGGNPINYDNLTSAYDNLPAVGRKSSFDPAFHPLEFINLSRTGESTVEIAGRFNISVTTLKSWSEKFEEFATAYEIGQALHESWWLAQGKGNLQNRHFNTTLFKFLTANKLGYAEKVESRSTNTTLHGVLLVPDTVTEAEWEESNVPEVEVTE